MFFNTSTHPGMCLARSRNVVGNAYLREGDRGVGAYPHTRHQHRIRASGSERPTRALGSWGAAFATVAGAPPGSSSRAASAACRSGSRPAAGLAAITLKYACMICVTAGTAIVAEPSPGRPSLLPAPAPRSAGRRRVRSPRTTSGSGAPTGRARPFTGNGSITGPNSAVPVLPAICSSEQSSRAARLAPSVTERRMPGAPPDRPDRPGCYGSDQARSRAPATRSSR